MSNNLKIVVYSLENCPNCELLKDYLKENGFSYDELDLAEPANMTELRLNNVFVREAPVLQVNETFLTSKELFQSGCVKDEVLTLCKGE
ncbi:glutaredoxin family protein [Methanomicrobium antiquum]|uniref:Glutaredoxin family protein n=1 Tax=Methanomicrobium antiquum TaxID=487686 RepID=A0AAF0FNH5_9EURY|nr:glutaredoxin domain-containing protein [Methanomicrobium antiquum]MDD3977449.1 glutaredoxin domain-containing protein [Methanomicrobium sp.]WFN35819.1 glutaredoxin family protein [Methanomicrobium antiquum]